MQTAVITTGGDVALQTQQLSECLKSTSGFFERTIHNLCDGSQFIVPYGFWDFVLMIGISGLLLAFVFLIMGMLFSL